MGYAVIYDRQFVKTDMGIIPIDLSGYFNDREVIGIHWGLSYGNRFIIKEEAELRDDVRDFFCDYLDNTICMYRGNWLTGKDMVKFFEDGIDEALPLESILARYPQQALTCSIEYVSDGLGRVRRQELCQNVRSTRELETWLSRATARTAELAPDPGVSEVWFNMGFLDAEPFDIDTHTEQLSACII